MRYVIYAILIYLVYLFIKSMLKRSSAGKQDKTKSKPYDINRIQEAEFREVDKDK
jgi:threonine/homoserine/homoserine lactone efflux protein